MKETLSYYCRYNVWANEKIQHFLGAKEAVLLDQPVENSFPSIRLTALHIYSAEKSWLARLQENPTWNKKIEDTFANPHEVIHAWIDTSRQFAAYVENKDLDFLKKEINYTTWDGNTHRMKAHLMIHHCMNHSTFHRGQLITMARQVGMQDDIPSTDLLYFTRES